MTNPITAKNIYSISLDEEGSWKKECLDYGIVRFGLQTDKLLKMCSNGDWDSVNSYWINDKGKTKAVATRSINKARTFFEDDGTTLWVTSTPTKVYWCFLSDDPVKKHSDGGGVYRTTKEGWNSSYFVEQTGLGRRVKFRNFLFTSKFQEIKKQDDKKFILGLINDKKLKETVDAPSKLMPKYVWLVRTGENETQRVEISQDFKDNDRISIDYSLPKDLKVLLSKVEVNQNSTGSTKSNIKQLFYNELKKEKVVSGHYSIWSFLNVINPGEFVFLRKDDETIWGVGIVTGEYNFYDGRDFDFDGEQPQKRHQHYRKVDWLSKDEIRFYSTSQGQTLSIIRKERLIEANKIIEKIIGPTKLKDIDEDYFGEIKGVNIGAVYKNRQELYDANVHRTLQAGIVGRETDGAESVVLSGGYIDDEDYGDVIIYTGSGGQDDNSNQISDQEFKRYNLALVHNHFEGISVRVIRGANHQSEYSPDNGYCYDGLFKVERYWREKGSHGFLVCRFRLVRDLGEEPKLPQSFLIGDSLIDAPTQRTEATVNRVVRDRSLAQKIKKLYKYSCQVCNERIEVESGHYAEAAHIKPLGRPHDGPDTLDNLLCLCPNHHVAFDNGGLFFSDDLSVNGGDQKLNTNPNHKPSSAFIKYHRSIWGK